MARSARTDDMAPTDERNLTLDERIFRGRSEHTCLKRLDELMFCLSAALAPASHRMRLAHTFSEFRCHGTPSSCFATVFPIDLECLVIPELHGVAQVVRLTRVEGCHVVPGGLLD